MHTNDGDQRNAPSEGKAATNNISQDTTRFEEGQEAAHDSNDPKDERSIKNRLAAEKLKEKLESANEGQDLPTDAARANGNEPSRGAKIDEQIMLEEEQELRDKGKLD